MVVSRFLAVDGASPSRRHFYAAVILAAGWFWDVVDINVGGLLATVFSAKTAVVSAGQASRLVSASYVGALAGALVVGWAADRFGRRRLFLLILVVFAITAAGAAGSPGIGWLTFWRLLSGLAIGSYAVVAVPYLAELVPSQTRGKIMLIAAGIGAVGSPATLLSAHVLTNSAVGSDAWRWICGILAAGAALTLVPALRLPESPKWLNRRSPGDPSRRSAASASAPSLLAGGGSNDSVASSLAGGRALSVPGVSLGRVVAFTLLLNLLSPWFTVGFPILSGAMLVSKEMSVDAALLFSGLGAIGIVVGLLVVAWKVDRIERRTALIGCALAMTVCGGEFVAATRPVELVVAGMLMSSGAAIYIQTLSIYIAEMFATPVRALGASSGWVVNRLSSSCVPLVLLPVLRAHGATRVFALQAVTLLLSALLLALAPRGCTRRILA